MVKKICLFCGKEFLFKNSPSRINRGKFCSYKCYWNNRKGKKRFGNPKNWKHTKETKEKIKQHNLKIGKRPPSRTGCIPWNKGKKGLIAWNKGKKNPNWKGKNNPNWKGGITPFMKQLRHLLEYKQWRSDVFQRDNWTCQTCRLRGGYLEAHHYPKEFSEIIREYNITTIKQALKCKELWDINNGVTLCCNCHNLTKQYGKKKT